MQTENIIQNPINFFSQYKMIDLTNQIHEQIPSWEQEQCFKKKIDLDYHNFGYRTMKFELFGGISTHIDAPQHFFKDSNIDISSLSLNQLVSNCCVIDLQLKFQDIFQKQQYQIKYNDQKFDYKLYEITVEDLQKFEKEQGSIEENQIVIFFTGWSKFWDEKEYEKYQNKDAEGQFHFPVLSKEVAEFLVSQKKIKGIGIDTLSPDTDETFPVHKILLGNNKIIIENLSFKCCELPSKNFILMALPINIVGATEAPARVIALVPQNIISENQQKQLNQ